MCLQDFSRSWLPCRVVTFTSDVNGGHLLNRYDPLKPSQNEQTQLQGALPTDADCSANIPAAMLRNTAFNGSVASIVEYAHIHENDASCAYVAYASGVLRQSTPDTY